MIANVLFSQLHGSVDMDGQNPNGVEVTLTKWVANDPDDDYRLPNHFVIKKVMMIEREYAVDTLEIFPGSMYGSGPALAIRNAINVFDQMVETLAEALQLGEALEATS